MPGQDGNTSSSIICNVTKNTIICVTLDAQGIMPGQDCNENQCVFCNIILGLWGHGLIYYDAFVLFIYYIY